MLLVLNACCEVTLSGCGEASPSSRRDIQSPRIESSSVNIATKMKLSAIAGSSISKISVLDSALLQNQLAQLNLLPNIVIAYGDETLVC